MNFRRHAYRRWGMDYTRFLKAEGAHRQIACGRRQTRSYHNRLRAEAQQKNLLC